MKKIIQSMACAPFEEDGQDIFDKIQKFICNSIVINFIFIYFRELQDGTLKDNDLMDGSKIILIPNVETGLLVSGELVYTIYLVCIFISVWLISLNEIILNQTFYSSTIYNFI